MKTVILSGAAALAITFGAAIAHAGGPTGGPPVQSCQDDDGNDVDCPVTDPGTGGTGGGTGGTGGGTGGTGGGTGGTGGGSGSVTPNPTATINFNAIGSMFSIYVEGDYTVKLLTGTISGGFGAYNTRGLDTLGPFAAIYVPGTPTPQFTLERTDGGFFTVDSFYNVLLSDHGVNTTTLQGYANGVAGGSSQVISSFNGFGYPQLSGLSGAYNKVVFTLNTSAESSGMSFDNLTVTAAAAPGAVPEPAAWALMLGGFGLVGAASRRRRAATVTA